MFRATSSPIIRSTWLYLQHLILSTGIAAGWCHGWTLPEAVNTVKCSWWWAKTSPEICRADQAYINKTFIIPLMYNHFCSADTRKCTQYRHCWLTPFSLTTVLPPHSNSSYKVQDAWRVSVQQTSPDSCVWRRAYGQLATNTRAASSLWIGLTGSSLLQRLTQRSIYHRFICRYSSLAD